ncbi:MAG: NUDIX hydrolase [Rhodobacteraceae bacterium]|nr:NUDIX hydrolase [Paracoccaceae bacterium]
MAGILHRAWTEVIQPLFRRPNRFQVAALCYRRSGDGQIEVLLITSRDTGRWILPKGWPVSGQDAVGSAVAEAWEEAGVKPAHIGQVALGSYHYDKRLRGGVPVTCETKVFPIEVDTLADTFPEQAERQRRWVTPQEAAGMVDEPGLRTLLVSLPGPLAA